MKTLVCAISWALIISPMGDIASGHDIYTGVKGKDGQLCCGGNDCFSTTYSERKSHFFFRLKPADGAIDLDVPADLITWLPVVGDTPDGPVNKAHLCYRAAVASDSLVPNFARRLIGNWLVFCAFIPPGGV